MKEKSARVLMAILLGLATPGFVIRLTAPQPELVAIDTKATQATYPQETAPPGIWVMTDEEQTQWMVLEEYLTGVILAEMPTSYDHQALCAQAVAARTYTMKRQKGEKHPNGAVCTDAACCQAYVSIPEYLNGLGYAEDVTIARNAVNATEEMVMTYDGELIEATYFHSSGGRTEEAVAVWGVDYPYLQVVDSPGEENMDGYTNRVFYSREDLQLLLNRQLPGSSKSWVGWTTYTVGGGVDTILLAGIQYSGIQLRSLLKLDSTAFTVQPEGDGLWFTTMGKGHRVGMSQTGAQAMALQGKTWQEILAHYYPGTRIDKMTDVG